MALWLLAPVVNGQPQNTGLKYQPFFEQYNTDRGLPHPLVHTICEDHRGFIWIGTPEGLSRFDGFYFNNFTRENSALQENNITSIYENTPRRILWVGTGSGTLMQLNLDNYQTQYAPILLTKEFDTGISTILCIQQPNDTTLLLGTRFHGLLRYHIPTGKVTRINPTPAIPAAPWSVSEIHPSGNQYYIASQLGLYQYSCYENHDQMKLVAFGNMKVGAIAQFDAAHLAVALSNEMWKINSETFASSQILHIESNISDLAVLQNNQLLIATLNSGLYYYNAATQKVYNFQEDTYQYSLPDNALHQILLSENQPILWLATKDGLGKINHTNNRFSFIDSRYYSDSRSGSLFMLLEDHYQNKWFWATDGLFRQRAGSERFSRIAPSADFSNKDTIYQTLDLKDRLLFASSKGIIEFNQRTEQFRYLPESPRKPFYRIAQIGTDQWIACSKNSIWIYNHKTRRGETFTIPESLVQSQSILLSMEVDHETAVWLGSHNGLLFKFCLQQKSFCEVNRVSVSSSQILFPYITALKLDSQGQLWVATQGEGLLVYTPSTRNFKRPFSWRHLSDNIYQLERSGDHYLWTSTHNGVYMINTNDQSIKDFPGDAYPMCKEFNQGASSITPDGHILMGGSNGFIVFEPQDRFAHTNYPKPILSSYIFLENNAFSIGERINAVTFNTNDTIYIPKNVESIRLHARILNYQNARKNALSWKINLLDSIWRIAASSSPIIYSTIPPGKHELIIRALDEEKQPIGEPLRLILIKSSYLHKYPAFNYAMVGLIVIVALTAFFYRYKRLQLQKQQLARVVHDKTNELSQTNTELVVSRKQILTQNQELKLHRQFLEEQVKIRTADLEKAKRKAEESDRLKTAFLANLSHEIRTPMNSIIGFTSLLGADMFSDGEKKEFIHLIQDSSDSLLVLINDIIDISRIESQQIVLNPTLVHIHDDINRIFKQLQFEKRNPHVQFLLEIDKNCEGIQTFTDKERFKQIISNLVSNAHKFSSTGSVTLRSKIIEAKELPAHHYLAHYQGEFPMLLLVAVADTGIGIAPEHRTIIFEPFRKLENEKVLYPGIGLGLSIVKKLTQLLEGEIWLHSEEQKGSTFYFYIPVKPV